MVYKNGLKEYFGIFLGLWLLVAITDLGLLYGFFYGYLLALPMTFVCVVADKIEEKKYKRTKEELKNTKFLICHGPVKQTHLLFFLTGWLFLCEDAIVFCPHKINSKVADSTIDLRDIQKVYRNRSKLLIRTNAEEFHFTVKKATFWERDIKKQLERLNDND